MLRINNVTKQLGKNIVLDHCTLEVKEGSVFGLIGPNGAGKSTLLRCIADVYRCDEGTITFNGETIEGNVYLKQNLLLMSDDPYYHYNATLAQMAAFYKTFYPQFDDAVYQKYLNIFKLDEHKVMNNFSKGMKRQAFILIALAIAPKLLLLDESFDGLDPMMRLLFKRAISEAIETKHMTVIISSHNLRELEDICDSFGILDEHKITTSGMLDETKDQLHKIQAAFKTEKQKADFEALDILHYSQSSRVITMVVRGDLDAVLDEINRHEPLMVDVLNVNLEEIFLYEMERKGVFNND